MANSVENHELAGLKLACVLCDWIVLHIFFLPLCWLPLLRHIKHEQPVFLLFSPCSPAYRMLLKCQCLPLLCQWWLTLSTACYTSKRVFYRFVPCCSSHSERRSVRTALKPKKKSSAFFYHRVCTIINVIRQMTPAAMDCHAAQHSLLIPLCSSLCLFPPFVSAHTVGCFLAGFVEPLVSGEH